MATSTLRRRASWIAVLPIALLHLAFTVHQFDHDAEYVDGACDVCAQLDRVDAAVNHPAEDAPKQSTDFLKLETPAIFVARKSVRNFDSRAPPVL